MSRIAIVSAMHVELAAVLAGLAQAQKQIPNFDAQQSDDDFAVRKGGVVVRDFAQSGRFRGIC
jgi:hypothetical protein